MAIYLELPVYKACNELYVEFVKIRRHLPRDGRYTMGQEIDQAMVATLVLLQRINASRDKVPLVVKARQLVAEIQVRVRALRDVRAMSINHFVKLFEKSSLSKIGYLSEDGLRFYPDVLTWRQVSLKGARHEK